PQGLAFSLWFGLGCSPWAETRHNRPPVSAPLSRCALWAQAPYHSNSALAQRFRLKNTVLLLRAARPWAADSRREPFCFSTIEPKWVVFHQRACADSKKQCRRLVR